jgi:hypothetical protein
MRKVSLVAFVLALAGGACTSPSFQRCPGKLNCKQAQVCCAIGSPIHCGGKCYETNAGALLNGCFAWDMETCQPEPQ